MTKLRSLASAIALLVIAPAPAAMAQLLDGLNLPVDVGGITDVLGGNPVDGNGVSVPLGGNGDVTIGGAGGLVDVDVSNVDGGGSISGLGVGDPGVVDAGIDGGNIAGFGLQPGGTGNLSILNGNPLENPGATVPVGVLGNNATVHLNRDGEIFGLHFGLGAPEDPEDPDPVPPGPNPNPGPNPGPIAGPPTTTPNINAAVANLSEVSMAQRRALRTRCRGILSSPDSFDEALVALCAALQ